MSSGVDRTPSDLRSRRPAGPWHEALAYAAPGELAARLAGRVQAALAAGDPVMAVLEDAPRQQLHTELGSATDGVRFLEPAAVHTVPGFTTAVRWTRSSRQAGPGARPMIVTQQLLDLPGCGPGYWARLCAGLEVAAAGLPLTVLCAFLDEPGGWARVRQTHHVLGTGCGSGPNPDYRKPHDVVREHPPPPPPEPGPPTAELAFRATDLGPLRHLTAEVAGRGGMASERVADAVLAVNELASNSVEHGPGTGRLRLWTHGAPWLLAEVSDRGRLIDPFPGMVHPSTSGPRGRGLWLASELCDVMEVWAEGGTVVRLSWLR
jgi:anti-sigma regulatory factor (Ser/Thr protein kinase)